MSRSRYIEEEVRNCCSCPFHYFQQGEVGITVEGQTIPNPEGYYCLHRFNRHTGCFLTQASLEDSGYNTVNHYLRHSSPTGEPFPDVCPLKSKDVGQKIIKANRRIDLT